MDIINEILTKAESRIDKELIKVKKDIDINPWEEHMTIEKELIECVNSGNIGTKKFAALESRDSKNKAIIAKLRKGNYLDDLFKKQSDLERQKNDLFKLRLYVK